MAMTKTILEDQLYSILQKYKQNNDYDLVKNGELAFEEYLREYSHDNEVWMRYALFFNLSNVEYPDKSVEMLERLLAHNKHDAKILLLLADIQDSSIGIMTKEVIKRLHEFHSDDNQEMSMIEYTKGRLCYYFDKKKYEECLIKSIQLCERHVWNHEELGYICIARGDIKQGCELIKKAIKNVKYIFPSTNPSIGSIIEIPTADEYIGEFITGTIRPQSAFEDLCKTYIRYCPIEITHQPENLIHEN